MSKKKKQIDVVKIYLAGDKSVNVDGIIDSFLKKRGNKDVEYEDGDKYSIIEIDKKSIYLDLYNLGDNALYASSFEEPSAFLYVYNEAKKETFSKFEKEWLDLINEKYSLAFKVIVGNILDKNAREEITEEDIQRVREKMNAHYFKIDINNISTVENMFIKIIDCVLKTDKQKKMEVEYEDDNSCDSCCSIF